MSSVQVTKVHTITGHRDGIYTIQPSSQPHLLFSGAGDGMVVAWNLKHPDEGELIAKLPNSVYALHHLAQEDLLVAGHNYEGIHLLDWHNKKELASLQMTTSAIFDIQSYKNDLIIGTGDGMLTIVDRNQWVIKKKLLASERSVRTIAVNPIAGEVAVGYSDNFIRIFDLDTYALKQEWAGHVNSVFTLTYSHDYKILLSGSRDARLKAWDVTSNYSLHEEVVAHLFAINHIAFSPDGKHFVTCSMDKSIKVWDLGQMKLLKVIDKARHAGHGTSVNKLLWTSFDNQLVSASDDRSLSIWNIIF
jgi:WD40 repeat protein